MTNRSDVRVLRMGVLRRLFDAAYGHWIAAAADLRGVLTETDAVYKRPKADEQ